MTTPYHKPISRYALRKQRKVVYREPDNPISLLYYLPSQDRPMVDDNWEKMTKTMKRRTVQIGRDVFPDDKHKQFHGNPEASYFLQDYDNAIDEVEAHDQLLSTTGLMDRTRTRYAVLQQLIHEREEYLRIRFRNIQKIAGNDMMEACNTYDMIILPWSLEWDFRFEMSRFYSRVYGMEAEQFKRFQTILANKDGKVKGDLMSILRWVESLIDNYQLWRFGMVLRHRNIRRHPRMQARPEEVRNAEKAASMQSMTVLNDLYDKVLIQLRALMSQIEGNDGKVDFADWTDLRYYAIGLAHAVDMSDLNVADNVNWTRKHGEGAKFADLPLLPRTALTPESIIPGKAAARPLVPGGPGGPGGPGAPDDPNLVANTNRNNVAAPGQPPVGPQGGGGGVGTGVGGAGGSPARPRTPPPAPGNRPILQGRGNVYIPPFLRAHRAAQAQNAPTATSDDNDHNHDHDSGSDFDSGSDSDVDMQDNDDNNISTPQRRRHEAQLEHRDAEARAAMAQQEMTDIGMGAQANFSTQASDDGIVSPEYSPGGTRIPIPSAFSLNWLLTRTGAGGAGGTGGTGDLDDPFVTSP
ncbi:hypothetical protein F5Y15DRAFT_424527 [Xylariaceae sp. FL0016]|nr:hypothetical protein F5Y15DRAFT_424527 [Xylariaceae sp. FL0016]